MKKVLIAIVAFLYLTTSVGATINLHYCMDKLYKVDMSRSVMCHKCGMKSGKGHCCKDKQKIVKVKDDQHLASSSFSFDPPASIPAGFTYNTIPSDIVVTSRVTTKNNSPPGLSGTSLCILHCVFRI